MAKSAILTLLILLSGATGCRLFASKNPIIGDYLVSGWDKSGGLDFAGRLSFTSITQGQLKGQCKVKKVREPFKDVLYKDGPCSGSLNGEKLILELSSMSDGEFTFDGEFKNDRIVGTWSLGSIGGSFPKGKFEAIRAR
jgi:hypothetical protein